LRDHDRRKDRGGQQRIANALECLHLCERSGQAPLLISSTRGYQGPSFILRPDFDSQRSGR
jgi:hypothetical protein